MTIPRAEPRGVAEQAAEWVARLPAAGHEERLEFIEWLKLSPHHVHEAMHALRISKLLDQHGQALWNVANDRGSQGASAGDHLLAPIASPPVSPAPPRTSKPRFASWQAAAVLAMAVTIGIAASLRLPLWDPHSYSSDADEWITAQLRDGTTVKLAPRSELQVAFDDRRRAVDLVGGSALFDVAKDTARPFIVKTDCCSVRARGTQFAVSLRENELWVTVAEGSVVVSQGSPARAASVGPNEQLVVASDASWKPQHVDPTRALAAWSGRLEFRDQTLAEAVDEFNRLNSVQLQLDDQSVARRPVRGSFDADDPRSFAYTLERTHGLAVVDGDKVLRLVPDRATRAAQRARSGDNER